MSTLTILGAGSWGTALANVAARNTHQVCLWTRRGDQARAINATGHNPDYLNDISLSTGIYATSDLDEACSFSDLWVNAIPTQSAREVLKRIAQGEYGSPSICNVAKGIEISTLKRPSEIINEVLPASRYSVLSGPSHAEETVRDLPTAVVVASKISDEAKRWQRIFNGGHFRVYTSVDVIGVEIGGAIKNIIAIASGMISIMKLGDNATAALVSRGLAEIMRLGAKIGAHPLTLSGLAGVGDLMVTCYSVHSRNYRLGMAIGRGLSLEEAQRELGQVAEGAFTVKATVKLARSLKVELPIAEAVNAILYKGASPMEMLETLLTRDPKPEYPPEMLWG